MDAPEANAADARGAMMRKPEVALLLVDGMWSHDVANVIQVFGNSPTIEDGSPCNLTLVGAGECAEFDHGLSAATTPIRVYDVRPDLVCIPGFTNPTELVGTGRPGATRPGDPHSPGGARPTALTICLTWLNMVYNQGCQVAALGSGTFLLAEAGLLSDVSCTTHHTYADVLATRYARVRLKRDRVLVHDAPHRIWSAAGGASGLDLCLSLMANLAGPAEASSVSEAMSLWRPRSLDTTDSAFGMPSAASDEQRAHEIERICGIVLGSLARGWTVAEIAQTSGMSERTFQRHFRNVMGEVPRRWLAQQRLAAAKVLLEQTDLPLPVVAARVGLSGSDALFRLFAALESESPRSYRARFRAK